MSDKVTLELPLEQALKMLPFFEKRRARLQAELRSVEAQIAAIKGESEKLNVRLSDTKKRVLDYLATLPALGGQSINAIAKGAGTSYGSTYRLLQQMKKAGEAVLKDDLWSLAPKPEPVEIDV